jgi:hypothetical protein
LGSTEQKTDNKNKQNKTKKNNAKTPKDEKKHGPHQ